MKHLDTLATWKGFCHFFCLTEKLRIVKECRRQAENKCPCVGGMGLEFSALAILGPFSAAMPVGFVFLEV